MRVESEFAEIKPEATLFTPTAAQISGGTPIRPLRPLQVMSPDDWEGFTELWQSFHKAQGNYQSVMSFSGPGDLGLDVVVFTAKKGFSAPLGSFQCKRYDHAFRPGDTYSEIGKIIYHSSQCTPPFNQAYRVPQRVRFSLGGAGTVLGRLLKDPSRFKERSAGDCIGAF